MARDPRQPVGRRPRRAVLALIAALACTLVAGLMAVAVAQDAPAAGAGGTAPTDPAPSGTVQSGPLQSGTVQQAPSARTARRPGAPAADAAEPFLIRYTGELLDENSQPISGVFTMTFRLFRSQDTSSPLWTERHHVAVAMGEYGVRLGGRQPLDESWRDQTLWLSVEIDSLGEIVRHEVRLTPIPSAAAPPEVTELTWASLADRALLADEARTARNCETLSGRTLEELDRSADLARQIVELRAQINRLEQGTATAPAVQFGTRTMTLEAAGGSGGTAFELRCPTNHVAVGVSGRAGAVIDSLTVICAPVQ